MQEKPVIDIIVLGIRELTSPVFKKVRQRAIQHLDGGQGVA